MVTRRRPSCLTRPVPVARRWPSAVLAALCLIAATSIGVLSVPGTAAAGSIGSDRLQITQMEQRIVTQGAAVQLLVEQYDQAQHRLSVLRLEQLVDSVHLQADRAAAAKAAGQLRQVALHAYMTGAGMGTGSSAMVLFDTTNATGAMARSEYTNLASDNLATAIDTFRSDQRRVALATAAVRRATASAARTVAVLAGDRRRAQAALAGDQAVLGQAKSHLQALLAAVHQAQVAHERALEQALAAQRQAVAPAAGYVAPAGSAVPAGTPGAYANPLRAISALSPERIDQGVDYSGSGPIYAIANGVVLNTTNSGWPGGTFITYRLTNGPAAGLVVYAAEDIYPAVAVGQQVTASTVLGTVYEGPDGIETGWADSAGTGYTMAHDYGQFSGSNSTAFGYNFSQLLQYLGAPGGILQNNPPTGTLPPGWPQW